MSQGMQTKRWTAAQTRAITARGCPQLVSAGAGSGKTSVLVERVIRRIVEENGDIDRLLIVTFTEAAAAEMKERIGRAIRSAAQSQERAAHLARQMHLLERSLITTLHSFCLQVIRRAGPQSAVGIGFRVADEQETGMVRETVLDGLLEESFTMGQPSFVAFVERYGGAYGDRDVRSWILRLYAFARSQPDPEAWLRRCTRHLSESAQGPLSRTHVAEAFFAALAQTMHEADRWLVRAVNIARQPGGPHAYEGVLLADRERLRQALQAALAKDYEAVRLVITTPFPKMPADRYSDKTVREQALQYRNKAKDVINVLAKGICSRPQTTLLAELADTVLHMSELTNLVLAFDARYGAAKRARGIVDFADLEHFAYAALSTAEGAPSAFAKEWAARFDEIMVDEYQDTSPIQDAIIGRIFAAGDCQLFQVGDVKQSIYRFRMAEPGLFLQKYQAYGVGVGGERVDLQENFRSRQAIVRAVNVLFAKLFSPLFGGLSYDERAQMQSAASYPSVAADTRCLAAPVEIVLIDRKPPSSEDDRAAPNEEEETVDDVWSDETTEVQGQAESADAQQLSACEQEARVIALRLQALMAELTVVWRPEQGVYEPLRYGDVAVLLRADGGRIATLMRVFRQYGIPCTSAASQASAEGYETRLLLSLLSLIDNPRQDIPLASVLCSPVGGFSTSDLARIRASHPRGDFYEAVRAAQKGSQPGTPVELGELPVRLAQFWQWLERLRTIARREGAGDTLAQVLTDSGLLSYTHGLPAGTTRIKQLQAIVLQARAYDALESGGLSGFARYLQAHPDEAGARASGGALAQLDAVRIMTIHSSKGLEFPVVFVAVLDKGIEPPKRETTIALHRTLGFGPQMVAPMQRERYETIASLAVKEQERRETLAEEARILYVALTRARERLFLVGSADQLDTRLYEWQETAQLADLQTRESGHGDTLGPLAPLPASLLFAARSYLDWLMPVYYGSHGDQETTFVLSRLSHVPSLPGESGAPRVGTPDWSALARLVPEALQWQDEAVTGTTSTTGEPLTTAEFDWLAHVFTPSSADVTPMAAKWSVTELKTAFAQTAGSEELASPEEGAAPTPQLAAIAKRSGRLATRVPQFITAVDTSPLTGARRGTAFHWIMEHLPLDAELAREGGAAAQLARLPEALQRQAQAVVNDELVRAVQRFFQTPLGRRMLAPGVRVLREASFTMALPADATLLQAVLYEAPVWRETTDDTILVQGMLDCLIIEPDGCVLLDYKTDRITGEASLKDAIKRYRPQLALYAQAAERALSKPITETVLYFIDGEHTISL